MPPRRDIHSILLIGSGPIVIGQACEFDYSGTQAAKVLRRSGYRVVLVNSNPATIMTDPEFADATYIEPITPEVVERIIERERPDALLPTLGGQTALNCTVDLARAGVLDRYQVEVLGASIDAIDAAEDRGRFKQVMETAGLKTPRAVYARSMAEAVRGARQIGYPVMIRPSFILGGGGTGVAADEDQFLEMARHGLATSPVSEILVEESVVGWKEFELEVMRDRADNAVIVCSIENLDPMGVHTGDSITVAPIQTLSDPEYQAMRDEAITCLRAIGVETGGSNVQFAVDPATGRRLVIEVNPRVSRSSALASKATGFPIAKIAALLAVGYTLDEITNDITGATPASFEPALDYVVVKVPRFDFAKFPAAPPVLGTTMRSVGEAMAIGTDLPRGAAEGAAEPGDGAGRAQRRPRRGGAACRWMRPTSTTPSPPPLPTGSTPSGRRCGGAASVEDVAAASGYDPWFVDQMAEIVGLRARLEASCPDLELIRRGEADRVLRPPTRPHLGHDRGGRSPRCGARRVIEPTFKTVDTCAAEFEAFTPYMYSTYEEEDEVPPSDRPRVMVLGSGPNRIGQGIEFDYCCVHAAFALQGSRVRDDHGQLQPRDRLHRLRHLRPALLRAAHRRGRARGGEGGAARCGGGATGRADPAQAGADASRQPGSTIAGTSPESIDIAEDRERFAELCRELGVRQPPHGTALSRFQARRGDRPHRFPGAGPTLVRPRGTGDAGRLQLRRAGRRPRPRSSGSPSSSSAMPRC